MVRVTAALIFAAGLVGLAVQGCAPPRDEPAGAELPKTMLWTWERPEDLSFLNSREADVGAAALVATVELRAPDRFTVRANRNPVRLPTKLTRVAVVRVENPQSLRDTVTYLDDATRRNLVQALVTIAGRLDVSGLQLDFDALRSQRDLYRALLVALRAKLPKSSGLGITALASWCMGDPWLNGLPQGTLDYAVPMLFRMGPDAPRIRNFLENGGTFRSELCWGDVGLSTDEPWPAVPDGVRRWVFAPVAWDGSL